MYKYEVFLTELCPLPSSYACFIQISFPYMLLSQTFSKPILSKWVGVLKTFRTWRKLNIILLFNTFAANYLKTWLGKNARFFKQSTIFYPIIYMKLLCEKYSTMNRKWPYVQNGRVCCWTNILCALTVYNARLYSLSERI